MRGDCELNGRVQSINLAGSQLELTAFGHKISLHLPLLGEHNVDNLLAAIGLVLASFREDGEFCRPLAGLLGEISQALEGFPGVPGRLERVDCGQDFTVLVDYAHTDDALSHALETLKGLEPNRAIVVFGCGGDRDQSKRPRMAKVAEQWSDVIVVTNDNPRYEDPSVIIDQIREGFSAGGLHRVTELPDRREAIEYALNEAGSGDVVLIAGKGHEDYQLVKDEVLHFDDCETVRELLR